MSNCDCCDSDFNTLGENASNPLGDLTLSTMVVGNQGAVFCRLIMVLLFLYAFTNQNFICHLINMNDRLLCNQMCLTDKMVDNMIDNCNQCRSDLEDCRRGRHNH